MKENGELGIEPRSSFEASQPEQDLILKTWKGKGMTVLRFDNPDRITVLDSQEGRALVLREEEARKQLVDRVEINTPDPYLNTLGANLVAAADGPLGRAYMASWMHWLAYSIRRLESRVSGGCPGLER
ncbi:MAG: hypothetical protein LKF06_00475 [Prevotella sp.]|nr:hypothetical protein [Prevotella sp.]